MSIRGVGFVVATLSIASVLGACKSSSDSSGDSACTTYAKAIVSYTSRCEGTVDPAQENALVSRFAQRCQSELSLPGVSGDAASALGACANAIQGASCNASFDSIAACASTNGGTLADGAACASGLECKSGACTGEAATGCGTCQAAVADGAACDGSAPCVAGDTCSFSASGAVCKKLGPPGDVGATCSTNAECKAPNHCALGSGSTGTCAAPVGSGGSCVETTDCDSGLICMGGSTRTCSAPLGAGAACTGGDCGVGYACDADLTCHAVEFVAPGGTCDGDERFCSKGSCPLPQDGSGGADPTGTCPTIIADGQPCDPASTTAQCDAFASCIGGKCTLVAAACK